MITRFKMLVIGTVVLSIIGVGIYVAGKTASAAQPLVCGGLIINPPQCPSGYYCKLDNKYPDQAGKCLPAK